MSAETAASEVGTWRETKPGYPPYPPPPLLFRNLDEGTKIWAYRKYIPGTKVSTYGGLPRRLQYRGEAERATVSFYVASVAE